MNNSLTSVKDILEEFKKLEPLTHKSSNYWHHFRFGEDPAIALYVPRFQVFGELTPFDYEYLSRIISVLKTLQALKLETKKPNIDIFLSTRSSPLPEEFRSNLGCLVLEPTNHNFSVVHKGEALVRVTLRLKRPFIPSNLWDQEQLLDVVQKAIWKVLSIEHEYYPVTRGHNIIFRDVFLMGAIIYSLKELQIWDDSAHLSFRVIFPPEVTVDEIGKKPLESIESTYFQIVSAEVEILRRASRITPSRRIHLVAEESFRETYGREPEYEWFPFPTVFNELGENNNALLAVGSHSHLSLTEEKELNIIEIEKSQDLETFTRFLSRFVIKMLFT